MNTKKISTWIFFTILILVFLFAIFNSINSIKKIISLDNINNSILKEESSTSDNESIDSDLYEDLDSYNGSSEDTAEPEQYFDDSVVYPVYSIDILNFEILLNDSRIDYSDLEEIYDGLKIYFGGKLKKDYIFYIDEESIAISDDEVSFKLIDASNRKEFEVVTIEY